MWGWQASFGEGRPLRRSLTFELSKGVTEKTILIVDDDAATAEKLRELLEFMDKPSVVTAASRDWKERIGDRRLEALFIGPELDEQKLTRLLNDLKDIDATVPVVMCEEQRS